MRKIVSQAILFLAFLCVAFVAIHTMWKTRASVPDESFLGSTTAERADTCRCLPGYIPYKIDSGTYTCRNLNTPQYKACY